MNAWSRWAIVWCCCLALGWWLSGCQSATSEEAVEAPSADLNELTLALELVASGLDAPLAVTHAGDDRLFIVERPGRIRIWRAGELLGLPFLDISSRVRSGGEQGLFSVAFHPNYNVPGAPGEGLFWVNYTDLLGDTMVERYTVSADDPDRADPLSMRTLLMIDQPFGNHNGGQLQFGPPEGPAPDSPAPEGPMPLGPAPEVPEEPEGERYLYIGLGDGGSRADPLDAGQRDDLLLGKMLRIAPSTDLLPVAPFYTIPPDNPRADELPPFDTIWAKGLRNPWRFSFDAELGHLYIGDVGQNAFEEVHVTEAGTPGGINYGWRLMEGLACFNPREDCDDGTLDLPVVTYQQRRGRCAIIGGYVYRGMLFPALSGVYLYADYCTAEIFGFRYEAASDVMPAPAPPTPAVLHTHSQNVLAFGEDASGELYLMDEAGDVYRIVVVAPAATGSATP